MCICVCVCVGGDELKRERENQSMWRLWSNTGKQVVQKTINMKYNEDNALKKNVSKEYRENTF